jgi:hypothetical protein
MLCHCFLFALGLVLVGLTAVIAQPPIEARDGKYCIPLTVDAVAPARPALKNRLLPELRELQTGNQVQAFYRCFFEQHNLFHSKESTDKQAKWMDAPLKNLANEKELINYGGSAYKQAHYAARLDTVDWQITNQLKSDGVMVLLPDVQQMRMLAAVLKVRVRGEIARGEFDNAIQTLQTMFALARSFNDHPTLIGHLVGAAIAMIAVTQLEEFVQQPGAPNLFWPLIDLPSPFIDLRKGREGEKFFFTKEYDVLRKAVPVPETDLDSLIKYLDKIPDDCKPEMLPSVYYAKQSADKDAVATARERLTQFGHKAADVAKLSPLQVVLMDDFARYQAEMDDYLKWTNVPFWQIPTDLGKKRPTGAFGELLPAYLKVTQAKVRLQHHIALLAVAEAVRAYAAENSGKLPASLDEVKLPLPVDPVSGKPFVYGLKEGKAILHGTPPADRATDPSFNRVYEISVRNTK